METVSCHTIEVGFAVSVVKEATWFGQKDFITVSMASHSVEMGPSELNEVSYYYKDNRDSTYLVPHSYATAWLVQGTHWTKFRSDDPL